MSAMNEATQHDETARIEQTLARLEQRLATVELMLGLEQAPKRVGPTPEKPAQPGTSLAAVGELEVAVGQNLFANIGIAVLAIGGALVLSLPWHGWPEFLPSLVGWWRKSVVLTGLAMVTGFAAALAVGTPGVVFGMVTGLSMVAAVALRRRDWPWLVVFATPCAWLTYLLWALGNPVLGHPMEVVSGPMAGVWLLLVWMVLHGLAMAGRRDRATEGPVAQVAAVLNCGGYFLVLLHTLIRYGDAFFAANVAASLVLLGLAVLFWVREGSRFATFVYAMTGYAALNMALIKATEVPDLFVWLSAQSLLVVSLAFSLMRARHHCGESHPAAPHDGAPPGK